jgi:pyruvyl transferase EpsI
MRIDIHLIKSNIYKIKYIFERILGIFIEYPQLKAGKKIIIFGTPEHDNLGDHAIVLAITDYLKEHFKDYQFVEITLKKMSKCKHSLIKYIRKDDIFIATGGGNMGNIYKMEEQQRRWIKKNFPNNIFVIMPQTIYYSDNEKGLKELNKTKSILDSSTSIIVARESASYQIARRNFEKSKILLVPDMVFSYINYRQFSKKTCKKIGICMRDDREKSTEVISKEIIKKDCIKYDDIEEFSTCRSYNVNIEARENEINEILQQISGFRIIITDRLHAMIFAYITRTPCIVFNGFNHKILSSYEWIKDCGYIFMAHSRKEMNSILNKVLLEGEVFYNIKNFKTYYDTLYFEIMKLQENL